MSKIAVWKCKCNYYNYVTQKQCGKCNADIEEAIEIDYDHKTPTTALDVQIGGSHYKNKGIQPLEYIFANNLGFCEGNAIKYITRYKDKNGIEDLKKAKHYIELLIEQVEKGD